VPKKFLVEYPNFLKPSQAYISRRTNESHVKTTMNDALKRYEQELQEIESRKKKDADNFVEQLEMEARF
jgi:hypothetical protein